MGRRKMIAITLVLSTVCSGSAAFARIVDTSARASAAPENDAYAWVATPPVPSTSTTTSTTLVPATTTTTSTTSAPPTSTTSTTQAPYLDGNSGPFALPPGATLPTDATCAKQIKKAPEVRSGNSTANHTKPSSRPSLKGSWGSDANADADLARIDGNFTGTTDEIIQWASCKWGLEPDVTRAEAIVESNWHQTSQGAIQQDQTRCIDNMQAPCPLAFGIMQIRADFNPATYPNSAASTAYNLDFALGMRRACYDGHIWLGTQTKGNAWGCVGVHYSGHGLALPHSHT